LRITAATAIEETSIKTREIEFILKVKALRPYFNGSDFLDIKVVQGRTDLRKFIAAMLSYYPWWVVMLYRLRSFIVHVLGLVRHEAPEELPKLQAEDISFSSLGCVPDGSCRSSEWQITLFCLWANENTKNFMFIQAFSWCDLMSSLCSGYS